MHCIVIRALDQAQQKYTGFPSLHRFELPHRFLVAKRTTNPSPLTTEILRLVLQRWEARIPADTVPNMGTTNIMTGIGCLHFADSDRAWPVGIPGAPLLQEVSCNSLRVENKHAHAEDLQVDKITLCW